MEFRKAFHSTIIITTVTKRRLKKNLESYGYFNIKYSGKDKGFHSNYEKGKKPVF